MKRTTAIVVLLLAAAWALPGVDLPKVKAVPLPRPVPPPPPYNFEIQAIKGVFISPCKVVYQVQYYISPTYPKACFIGANVPDAAHPSSSFGYGPAGRLPAGVPKGQKNFADNITFDLKFVGSVPYAGHSLEVKIYDADGVRKSSRIFTWNQEWTRFQVQGIKRVTTRPEYVKFQVQYFIDPEYTLPCHIGAYIPDRPHQNANFSYHPALTVPKGQKHFADNIWFDAAYSGATPFTSSTIEVVIYNSSGNLKTSVINWGQTWSTAVY